MGYFGVEEPFLRLAWRLTRGRRGGPGSWLRVGEGAWRARGVVYPTTSLPASPHWRADEKPYHILISPAQPAAPGEDGRRGKRGVSHIETGLGKALDQSSREVPGQLRRDESRHGAPLARGDAVTTGLE